MKHNGKNDKVSFFKDFSNAIFSNFTQAMEVRSIKDKTGADYPGYHCPQRKELNDQLKQFGPDHHQSIADVNDGHDMVETPLHPVAKDSLLNQVKQNHKEGLSPFQSHAYSQAQENHNAFAFFKASKDSHKAENLAGAFIHFSKGLSDGISQEMLPSEEFKVKFSAK
ncbi:hypothetical protein DIZ81_13590 [Legionella taurinensis]|uniref:Uncharacterized protein n=2 Tax=Legionella taurinensis TaxID=70611 RepID=A0A3A5L0F8_9GAMM|nr:hypothetical protein [Legionella taurinensis]PUT38651.1 hypothetical protein DB744_13595 [Legionella taurinensis]PUT38652.1 hypothetical protein DB744_13600 [Legionella taurinensis]PUT39849.1 hypothetical protein DB746_12995 [Legionella taurinensis]PUT39850.1 hypothetical protein DB746_13000 [Legionella taurinensis]PUT41841.1 hypothetical protein DB743_13480 [Legionella taurinensis]